jgi:hypothetical protein
MESLPPRPRSSQSATISVPTLPGERDNMMKGRRGGSHCVRAAGEREREKAESEQRG